MCHAWRYIYIYGVACCLGAWLLALCRIVFIDDRLCIYDISGAL
jgi:hypothetical protein